jgi:hypothetical protein
VPKLMLMPDRDHKYWHTRSRYRRAALAADRRRYAMRSLLSASPLAAARAGLVHHVDPAGRDIASARVDLHTAGPGDVADLREPPALNRHVREHPRIAHAVEHTTAANDDVVVRGVFGGWPRQEERGNEGGKSDSSDRVAGHGPRLTMARQRHVIHGPGSPSRMPVVCPNGPP